MRRKIVQIAMAAVVAPQYGSARYVLALCDDGTLWFKWEVTDDKEPWKEVEAPEGGEVPQVNCNFAPIVRKVASEDARFCVHGKALTDPCPFCEANLKMPRHSQHLGP